MFTNTMRFTGMFSGMDTQAMVTQMMRAESFRLNRLNQRRQLVEWRQENFRQTAQWLTDFRQQHFDVLRPGNLLSRDSMDSAFNTMRTTINGQNTSNMLTARVRPDAQAQNIQFSVLSPSRPATITGPDVRREPLTGTTPLNAGTFERLGETLAEMQDSPDRNVQLNFNITFNGAAANIVINSNDIPTDGTPEENAYAMLGLLNDALQARFGTQGPNGTGGARVYAAINAENLIEFRTAAVTDAVRVSNGTTTTNPDANGNFRLNALPYLGLETHTSNYVEVTDSALGLINAGAVPGGYNAANRPAAEAFGRMQDDNTFISFGNNNPGITTAAVEALWAGQSNDYWTFDRVETRTQRATMSVTLDNGNTANAAVSYFNSENGRVLFIRHNNEYREVTRDGNGEFTLTDNVVTPPNNSNHRFALNDTIHRPVFAYNSPMVINGTSINIYSNDTINNVMNRINTSGAGVTMDFNRFSGAFTLTANGTGMGAQVNITQDASGFLQRTLGLTDTFESSGPNGGTIQESQDLEIYVRINGVSQGTRRLEGNTFNINGVYITLTGAAVDMGVAAPPPAGPWTDPQFTINVARDVDSVIDNIRNFVDSFNEMFLNLHTMTNTARPRANNRQFFEPLTDEQRNAMSEREVQQWEERAMTGLLHRDNTIRNIHQQMRTWVNAGVTDRNGNTVFLSHLGITTGGGPANLSNIGLLQINEEQLRHELQTNPERVMDAFNMQPPVNQRYAGTPQARNARMGNQGVAHRLRDIIYNAIREGGSIYAHAGVVDRPGSMLNNRLQRQMSEYDRRIENMTRQLERRENQFFAMFARMEQAMMRSNQQMESIWSFMDMR